MRGVRVKESTTVRTQLLDRFLRCDRAARQILGSTTDGVDLGEAVEVLHDATHDQDHGGDHGQRKQQAQDAAGQVDPEVADGARPAASKAAHQRNSHRDTDGCRHKVLYGEPRHLHHVAQSHIG